MPGSADKKELVITRTFNAPREDVFKAWTDADDLRHWWAPKGFTVYVKSLDLREGGVFHYSQKSPEGHEMWGKFIYKEISAPNLLVFVNSFSDGEGNTVRAPFNETWPLEILNKLEFIEHESKTTLILRGGPMNASEEERKTFEAALDGIRKGFARTFDSLTEYLA
ncbi:SRPBCC family protein [Metabacillus sp. RGM 3146]|uniref:SRPBCC family protein n=1 Tax=Metabacillus sp. RGM 3146 TaxID=3401092 RepID=UPI003B9907B0